MSKPSHCWQCGKPLNRHQKTGRLIYKLVRGYLRVHKICFKDALVAAGVKMEPPPAPEEGRTMPAKAE